MNKIMNKVKINQTIKTTMKQILNEAKTRNKILIKTKK